MSFVKVADVEQIEAGKSRVVRLGGRELAVFNIGGEFYCIENSCPHNDGPLGEGELQGDVVVCPWHAWQFNVRTGEMVYNANVCVSTYPCKVADGAILVEI